MEYAQSYALYNYKKLDNNLPLEYDNLALIRSFSGMESESGFILVCIVYISFLRTLELKKEIIGPCRHGSSYC